MLFTMRETFVDRNPKMALPAQNINHSAFRSLFEREKISGNNFNDWFSQLKLVLRVEKKMFVIEQPLPAAPDVDSNAQVLLEWNALYYAPIEGLNLMFEKQAGSGEICRLTGMFLVICYKGLYSRSYLKWHYYDFAGVV
ncbi:hypothetical protein Tco_0087945 [Tanacetum coccineum]